MKILKRILIVLVILAAIAAIIPAFLGSHVHCERSLTIYAPAENAYYLVADFKNWNQWSPWHKMDPNWKLTHSGPDQGTGSSYSWESQVDSVGSGSMTIASCNPADSIFVNMEFKGMGPATCRYRFKRTGDSTKITMTMDTDMPYFFRVFGGMMKENVEGKYEQGLKTIKAICEDVPKKKQYDVIESSQNEQPYLSIRDTCTMATIGAKYMQNFPAVFEAAGKSGNIPAGPPFAIIHSDTAMTIMDIEWCVPVSKPATASGNFKAGSLKGGKMIKVEYYGPYEQTAGAYGAMEQWLASKGKKRAGKCREVYITDPQGENGKMDRVLTVIVADVE
ncbi:MAG: hypothetical protein FD123_3850 [Bacteroidetes bacterium]|nr:MAG: hypothetical protein FD123_3850 [Bacteroidota bacterium]